MDFRVYVVIEMPILDRKYELLKSNFYERRDPVLISKTNGTVYDLNAVIKKTDIKNGTRLLLL